MSSSTSSKLSNGSNPPNTNADVIGLFLYRDTISSIETSISGALESYEF